MEKHKANREKHLKPHKERFTNLTWHIHQKIKPEIRAKLTKERNQIIIDLVRQEPSHLAEPWIIFEVVRWLRDPDCDYLVEELFSLKKSSLGVKRRYTKGEQRDHYKEYKLAQEIDRIVEENNISRQQAYEKLAEMQAENPRKIFPMYSEDGPIDLVNTIKKMYERHQKRRVLPKPYWGYDYWEV